MIFFEDFIKSVMAKEVELKEKEVFRLNLRKTIVWLGTGVPLVLIGGLQIYLGIIEKGSPMMYLVSGLFILMGLYNFKMAFGYKITVKTKEKILFQNGVEIKLDELERCELKKIVPPGGKKMEACMDIVTKEKKQFIIPLMMRNRLRFVAVIKKIAQDKFEIIGE